MPGKLNDANFKVTKVQEEEAGVIESFKRRLIELHEVNFGVTKNQEETQGTEATGFFSPAFSRLQAISETIGIDSDVISGPVDRIVKRLESVIGTTNVDSEGVGKETAEVISVDIENPSVAEYFRVFTEISGIIDGRINNLSKFRTRVATSVVGVVEDRSLKPIQSFKESVGVEGEVLKIPGKSLFESIGVLSDKAYRMTFARIAIIGVREDSDVGVRKTISEAISPVQKTFFGVTKQVSEAIGLRPHASFFYRAVNLSEVVGLIDDRTVQPILQRSSIIGISDEQESGVGKSVTAVFTGEQSVTFGVGKEVRQIIGTIGEVDTVKTFGLIIRQTVGIIDQKVSNPIINFAENISPEQVTIFGPSKGISQGVGVSDTVARVRTRVIRVVQSIGISEKRAMGVIRAFNETISPEQPISKSLRRTFQETIIGSDFDEARIIKNPVVRQVRVVGSNILTIIDSGLSQFKIFNRVNSQNVINPRNQIMIFDQAREVDMTDSENSVQTLDRQNDVETFDRYNES